MSSVILRPSSEIIQPSLFYKIEIIVNGGFHFEQSHFFWEEPHKNGSKCLIPLKHHQRGHYVMPMEINGLSV